MRSEYVDPIGKFDSPITQFVFERVILEGLGDDFVSNADDGGWAERVGKRIVESDSRGFVYSTRFPSVPKAMEVFAELARSDYYDDRDADERAWDEMTQAQVSAFTDGYVDAADFVDVPDLDHDVIGWHESTLEALTGDAEAFLRDHTADLVMLDERDVLRLRDAGADLWLTRNGHGAGYWARDYGQPEEIRAALQRLTEAATALGPVDLYVGDDGWIYQSGEMTNDTGS